MPRLRAWKHSVQQSMGQSANTCSHSCVVLFQMGQCANNRVRHNTGSGTARPSGLRRQSLCPWLNPTYSQPPIQPPAVPQHFCTAQKALARSLTTKSAGEVPQTTEISAAHAPAPTLPRLHSFPTSLHSTVDGSSTYPGKWQWPFLPPTDPTSS